MTPSNLAPRSMPSPDSSDAALTSSHTEPLSGVDDRTRNGKFLILAGFVVAVLGIVAYCVIGLNAPTREGAVAGIAEHTGPALAIIGLGTLLWLVGSILFLNGALDREGSGNDEI